MDVSSNMEQNNEKTAGISHDMWYKRGYYSAVYDIINIVEDTGNSLAELADDVVRRAGEDEHWKRDYIREVRESAMLLYGLVEEIGRTAVPKCP